jgi:hypothetical protein
MASLILSGSTSGSVTLSSPAVSGTTTLTLPTTTDTLVGKTTTDTLTNKTLTSPAIDGTPTGVGVLTSSTAQATTSGTSKDFTSIPSWVKRVTVIFDSTSLSGGASILVQIGSGSVTTSGYVSSSTTGSSYSSTSGYIVGGATASNTFNGLMTIIALGSSNVYVESLVSTNSGSGGVSTGGGRVALGGTLDRVRITSTNGTDTFDAGSVNIMYE